MRDSPDRPDERGALICAGADLTRQGRFSEALAVYRRAAQMADAAGDAEGSDAAEANIAMVLLQMGEAREAEEGLREILLRTRDPEVAFGAAYNLASSLRKQGRYERALVYARRAMERAEALGSAEFLAPVRNLMGNILLNQGYQDEALVEYRGALALREAQSGDTRFSRAILAENIGYCLVLRKEFDAGIASLEEALALAEEVGDRRCRAECLQDLCYALLLCGRFDAAAAHGDAALLEAGRGEFRDIEENCHYLLGEVGTRSGDFDRRDRHFAALQASHPEIPFLHDFLCAVDVTGIITLKR